MKFFSARTLTRINFTIAGYFLLMYLVYELQIQMEAVNFLLELLTIPMLIAEFAFLLIGILKLIEKNSRTPVFIVSIAALLVSTLLTFGSLF